MSEMKYRSIVGEVIQVGDEYLGIDGKWSKCHLAIGCPCLPTWKDLIRRPIQTQTDQESGDRVSKIIDERGVVYGNPEDSMRNIGVAWTAIIQQHYGITLDHPIPDWVAANMLVAFKLQRTMKGWKLDNYDDAEAYLRFAKSMQGASEVAK